MNGGFRRRRAAREYKRRSTLRPTGSVVSVTSAFGPVVPAVGGVDGTFGSAVRDMLVSWNPSGIISTTSQLRVLQPLTNSASPTYKGFMLGSSMHDGSPWFHDGLLDNGSTVSNSSLLVMGDIRQGKTNFVLAYLEYKFSHGVRLFCADIKDAFLAEGDSSSDYRPLFEAIGGAVLSCNPRAGSVFNFLSKWFVGVGDDGRASEDGQVEAALDLLAFKLDGPVREDDEVAVSAAIRRMRSRRFVSEKDECDLDDLIWALLNPVEDVQFRLSAADMRSLGMRAAMAFRNVLRSELGRLIGGQSTVSFDAPAVLFSIGGASEVNYPFLMLLASRFQNGPWSAVSLGPVVSVFEEIWRALRSAARVGASLESNVKLARESGKEMVFVVHRLGDIPLDGPGKSIFFDAGSYALFGMKHVESGQRLVELLGLSTAVARCLRSSVFDQFVWVSGTNVPVWIQFRHTEWENALHNSGRALDQFHGRELEAAEFAAAFALESFDREYVGG